MSSPSPLERGNLFAAAEPPATGEYFEPLLRQRNLVIERILSSASPEPGEYVQAQDEWVVLLRGSARLRVAAEILELTVGDWLFLPAGLAHTVERSAAGSLWLAVHLHPQTAQAD